MLHSLRRSLAPISALDVLLVYPADFGAKQNRFLSPALPASGAT
jgi:hypothetical protein